LGVTTLNSCAKLETSPPPLNTYPNWAQFVDPPVLELEEAKGSEGEVSKR